MTTFWQEVLARPREIFARLTRAQRMGVLALVSIGLVVAVLASVLAGRENFVVLYGGLEVADAQQVCAKLTEIGVPYQLSPDNSMVKVPEQKVADVRMQLAGAGLPKLGSPGFEIFDQTQFGLTDALFNVNLQRALQGEIEQSIETLNAVKKARVIITLPPQATYLRDQARPTASVNLWLRPGLPLSTSEIAAIAHSVAAGVGRGIKMEDVTIIDGDARLLHPRGDENDPMFSAAYLEKVQGMEKYLQDKAESQLRAAFGDNKASVRVSVELDLNYRETAKDSVAEDNRVPVKEITSTDKSGSGSGGTTGGDPSVAAAGKATKEPAAVLTHEDSETTWREGSERELTIMKAGAIRRMTVSLLLDESDEALKAKQKEIEKAVKSAVGFTELRASKLKDEFNVVLAPFTKPAAPEKAPGPFAIENLLPLAGHLAEGVTVLFVLIFLARLLRSSGSAPVKAKAKPAAGTVAAAVAAGDDRDEDIIDLEMGEARGADLRSRVGRFVNRHPDQAREVLVAWLKEELAS